MRPVLIALLVACAGCRGCVEDELNKKPETLDAGGGSDAPMSPCAMRPDGTPCGGEGTGMLCVAGDCRPPPMCTTAIQCAMPLGCVTFRRCSMDVGLCAEPEVAPDGTPCSGTRGMCQSGVCRVP